MGDSVVSERSLPEKWGPYQGGSINWMVPWFPGEYMKEFWVIILSEAKRPQTQCLSAKGEFWVCSEANFGML